MKTRAHSLLSLILLAAAAGAAADGDKLIGGTRATPGDFPFVVKLSGCTGTKIGPRHFLYAAHCVWAGPGRYSPPSRVSVTSSAAVNPQSFRLRVAAAHIHETWIAGCLENGCTGRETGTAGDDTTKVDLALIQVEEITPSIPSIEVEFAPIAPGSEATLAGYGCTSGIGSRSDGSHLRVGTTLTGESSLLIHPGSLYSTVATAAAESYVVSHATSSDARYPGLCPGDSGGPLLVRANAQAAWKIAGVASDYTFTGRYEGLGGIPVTNLHTRLDDQSRHQIGEWIRARMR